MAPRILECAIWMKKTDSPSKRFNPETLDVGEETSWKSEHSEQENVRSWPSTNRETVRTSSTMQCLFFVSILER